MYKVIFMHSLIGQNNMDERTIENLSYEAAQIYKESFEGSREESDDIRRAMIELQ